MNVNLDSVEEFVIRTRRSYIENKTEQQKFLETLIAPYLVGKIRVLDACCGIGDAIYFLNMMNPGAEYLGIDLAEFTLVEARKYFEGCGNVRFERADVNNLVEQCGIGQFDLSVCMKTLSWLPSYEDAMAQIMAVTRKAVFISSLFYDGWIDHWIRVKEYVKPSTDNEQFYNVYSFPRFREFCLGKGAKQVEGFDFKIGIDLPKPADPDRMGTYTLQLDNGERIQISGALLMPWKIVRIDME